MSNPTTVIRLTHTDVIVSLETARRALARAIAEVGADGDREIVFECVGKVFDSLEFLQMNTVDPTEKSAESVSEVAQ